jgi:hypothetical protein
MRPACTLPEDAAKAAPAERAAAAAFAAAAAAMVFVGGLCGGCRV